MSFAGRLRIFRKEKGYSQEKLAEELNVSRQTVTKWEAGDSYPEMKTLVELSALLDKDLDLLLSDEISEASGKRKRSSDKRYDDRKDLVVSSRASLNKAMEMALIKKILLSLGRWEVTLQVKSSFAGTVTYTVFDGHVYAWKRGIDEQDGMEVHSFDELEFTEMETFLCWLKDFTRGMSEGEA